MTDTDFNAALNAVHCRYQEARDKSATPEAITMLLIDDLMERAEVESTYSRNQLLGAITGIVAHQSPNLVYGAQTELEYQMAIRYNNRPLGLPRVHDPYATNFDVLIPLIKQRAALLVAHLEKCLTEKSK